MDTDGRARPERRTLADRYSYPQTATHNQGDRRAALLAGLPFELRGRIRQPGQAMLGLGSALVPDPVPKRERESVFIRPR